jgi:hypothetical protein
VDLTKILNAAKPKKSADTRVGDRNRFIIGKETKREFKLKEADIPVNMREEISSEHFTDLVTRNISHSKQFSKVNTALYLNKLKLNLDHQINATIERDIQESSHREKNVDFINKWDDFRKRRLEAIDRYIAAVRKKKSMEAWATQI